MYFRFFISVQHDFLEKNNRNLRDLLQKEPLSVSTKADNILNLMGITAKVNEAHNKYLYETRDICGFFKSFIAGTNENKARMRCANLFADARKEMQPYFTKLREKNKNWYCVLKSEPVIYTQCRK